MKDATFLIWLAVIATGSQLIAVIAMWRLQRWSWKRAELSPEERRARLEEEARIAAQITVAAQLDAARAGMRTAIEEAIDRG